MAHMIARRLATSIAPVRLTGHSSVRGSVQVWAPDPTADIHVGDLAKAPAIRTVRRKGRHRQANEPDEVDERPSPWLR